MDCTSSCEVMIYFPAGCAGGIEAATAMVGLRMQLQYFGTVVAVEPVADAEGWLLVRYYDSWAAGAAREAFGAYGRGEQWEESTAGYAEGCAAGLSGDDAASSQGGVEDDGTEASEKADAEPVKPGDAACWAWAAAPTQATLEPLSDQDTVTNVLNYLSPTSSSDDLESLSASEVDSTAAGEPMSLAPGRRASMGLGSEAGSDDQAPASAGASLLSLTGVTLASTPKSLGVGLQLSHLNWDRLAKGQEWRRDLMLRGLPQRLCSKASMAAFLDAKGLRGLVADIRVVPGKGLKPGTAVLFATSADATAKLAKFFHGAQLPGCRSPVAVGFAPGKFSRPGGLSEPMRVSSAARSHGLPMGVPMPPGLEC